MACKLDKEYLLHHLAQTGLSQTQRERDPREGFHWGGEDVSLPPCLNANL